MLCKNTCVCEVNKLERRFYLVDAQVLPEVFLKVVRAKELLASGEARSISAATRSVDLSRSAFYKYKDCIFDSENGREVITVMATLRDETGALQSLLAGISAAGASIVTINQSTPENGAALVAVTIRTDTMQMTPEELTEKLSRQRMVVGVHCGYNPEVMDMKPQDIPHPSPLQSPFDTSLPNSHSAFSSFTPSLSTIFFTIITYTFLRGSCFVIVIG